MREYKIRYYNLWYIIYRQKESDWETIVEYRNWKWRDNRKGCVKEYFFKDEALSHLIVAKRKWNDWEDCKSSD